MPLFFIQRCPRLTRPTAPPVETQGKKE
ncbi:hypothetical protein A2U01_0100304 [Trifolium medium]|uniref:Uncharacterized protein n=1 Tax=Trifolium medium TaxID=97028 RepID=A0A392UV25_9FABA|nr:hypothetical protein [Trifolium medium]